MRDIRATVHLISISAIVICFLLVFEGFGDNLTVDADGGGADYTSLNDVLDALNGGVTTDTVLFIGSDQDTYEMSEYLGNYDPDTLVFISTQTGPDMYPVIQRPSENYQNLFDNTSVVFERLIFEGSQEFDIYSSVDQVFRKCVFRDFTNSNGAILLQSEGGGVTIENSLFFNNANCIRLNIWQGYEFHVVNSTFDDNDTVFSVEKIEYDTQYSQLQNNIFSNNTVIVPSAYDELLLRISYSLTDESLSGYGTDCVSGDPDYKTETGRSLPSDWDIDVDSKAIGIGVSDALTPDDDIAGRLREVIDAGCWKYIEPPSITTAAYSDSVAIEDSVTIIAEAVGAEPFTWQWFKDSVELTDETGDTLKISSVAPSDSGVYSAAAHNAGGHDTADICTLSVGEAVTIESHPQSVTVVENEDHTFSVTATGAGTLHYQWQKDSVDIDGATDSSVTVTGITGSDTGAYRCIITSNYGADSSDNAVLSIGDPGRIETQPEDVYLNPGDTAVFSVTATGDTPLSYQWQEDQSGWTDISGETDTVFKVPDVVLGDDALYRCFVTNDLGSDTSVTAELSVGEPPTISSHPEDNVYAPESSDVVFTVSHDTAYGEYHYEWEMDSGSGWELLSGSDTDSLLLTQVSASDEGDYRVRIINPYGEALSDPALLGICYPPSIGEQPGNQGVVLGDSAHFSVSAEGTNLKYQWQDNTADSDWSDIESATDSVYSLMPVSEDDGTYYRVVLSGECGEEVSDSAVLSVCTPPNGITGPDITSHSADEYIIEGDDVTIEVGAEGTDPSYQWQNSTGGSTWSDIQGATEPSYSFNPTSDHDEKHYRAGITACSVTEYSDGVVVTVNDTPRILTHPDDVTVDEDQTAEFSIEAAGDSLTYTWEVNTGSGWSEVPDSDVPTLVVEPVYLDQDGNQYRAVVSSPYSVNEHVSDPATLGVNDITPPESATSLSVTAPYAEEVVVEWGVPESYSEDADQVYVIISDSAYSGIDSKNRTVIYQGSIDPGIAEDTKSVTTTADIEEDTKYYVTLWLTDTTGNRRYTDSVEVTTPNALKNSFAVQASYADSEFVSITLSGFCGIKSDGLENDNYAERLLLWKTTGERGYISDPDTSDPAFVKGFSVRELQNSSCPDSFYDTLLSVDPPDPESDSLYYFTLTSLWHYYDQNEGVSGDTLLPVDTNNCDNVFMLDTASVENTLVFEGAEYRSPDTLILSIKDTGDLDPGAAELRIWYGGEGITPDFGEDPSHWVSADSLREAFSNDNQYRHTIVDYEKFDSVLHTVHYAALLKGENGKNSDTIYGSIDSVGYSRPDNPLTLNSSLITNSSFVRLSWEGADEQDSIRIWYGSTESMPLQWDYKDPYRSFKGIRPNDTVLTVTSLEENTLYWFGIQVYDREKRVWSYVTDASRDSITTGSYSERSVENHAEIDSVYYVDEGRYLVVKYSLDTSGLYIGSDSVEIGAALSTSGFPDDSLIHEEYVYKVSPDSGEFIIEFDDNYKFDTEYSVAAYLRPDEGQWSDSASSAYSTVTTGGYTWDVVSFFSNAEDDSGTAYAFDSLVAIRWSDYGSVESGEMIDTIKAVDISSMIDMPEGIMIPDAAVPFYFARTSRGELAFPPIDIGVRVEMFSGMMTPENTGLYYISDRKLCVFHDAVYQDSTFWVNELQHNDLDNEMLMAYDTVAPEVVFSSDTGRVVSPKERFSVEFSVKDNVYNSRVEFRYYDYKDNWACRDTTVELSGYIDTVDYLSVPGNIADEEVGLFSEMIVSDGTQREYINISRQAQVSDAGKFLISGKFWTPVRTTSVLEKTGFKRCVSSIAAGDDGGWEYDPAVFRAFRYYDTSDVNDYMEFDEAGEELEDQFDFLPGRVIWIKTAEDQEINFGKGLTTPLKESEYNTVTLKCSTWTDISNPYNFDTHLSDIIDEAGDDAESLEIRRWSKDDSLNTYIADGEGDLLYNGADRFFNTGLDTIIFKHEQSNDCYAVYNRGSDDIELHIPGIPKQLSRDWGLNRGVSKGRHGSSGDRVGSGSDELRVDFTWKPYTGMLKRKLHCIGSEQSETTLSGPVVSGFGSISCHIIDDKGDPCSWTEKGINSDGGSWEIRIRNTGRDKETIEYGLSLAAGKREFRTVLYDPVSDEFTDDTGSIAVKAGESVSRWVVSGSSGYLEDFRDGVSRQGFAVESIHPNPFSSVVRVKYSIPYMNTGVHRIRFSLFDVAGRNLISLQEEEKVSPGIHNVSIKAGGSSRQHLASGLYILKMRALSRDGGDLFTAERKLLRIR